MKSTSMFDGMTTVELEEMLRRDLRGEGEELDAETVLAALTVLERRDRTIDCDPAAMWMKLEARLAGDRDADEIADEIAVEEAQKTPEKRRGRLHSFARKACCTLIAATLLVALVSAVLIATGHGENMWQALSGMFAGEPKTGLPGYTHMEFDGMLIGRDGSVTEGQKIEFELKLEDGDAPVYSGWVEASGGLKVTLAGDKQHCDGGLVWYDDSDLCARVFFAQNFDFIMVEDRSESGAGLYVAKSPDATDERAAKLFEQARAAVCPDESFFTESIFTESWYQNPFVAIPPLEELSNMEYSDIVSALLGKHRDDIIAVWGEPQGCLSGMWGDIWFFGPEDRITVYYDLATMGDEGAGSNGTVVYVLCPKSDEEPSPSAK